MEEQNIASIVHNGVARTFWCRPRGLSPSSSANEAEGIAKN